MFVSQVFWRSFDLLTLVGTEIPPPQRLILLAEEIVDLGLYHREWGEVWTTGSP
jgi:hypothetical protein